MIEIKNLHKAFGQNQVLKGVDITVNKGDVVVVIGPSGSGKTTMLRCINFLERADEGTITVGDITVDAAKAKKKEIHEIRLRTAMVFQNYNLFANKTALGNVMEGLTQARGVSKEKAKEIALDALEKVGLKDKADYYPSQLSGGQQQRVALARMMIGEPEAILLDEPFSALDSYLKDVLQREMQDFLKDYPGDMILVTHSRDEAYKFCRELSIVHEGRILVTGEIKQLFERPGLLEAAKLTGCKNFSRAERLGPHEIYAADWKMKLHTEENVDEDITYVGIRGHWIRPESEPGENCMAVQVDQYIETTFEHQYMIRNKAEENAAGLWWMRPKNSFTEDPDKDLPEYLYLPPEHLMLLK